MTLTAAGRTSWQRVLQSDGGKGCSAGEIDRGKRARAVKGMCADGRQGRTSSRMEEQPFGELLPYFCLFSLIFTDAGRRANSRRAYTQNCHRHCLSRLGETASPRSSSRVFSPSHSPHDLLVLARSSLPPRPSPTCCRRPRTCSAGRPQTSPFQLPSQPSQQLVCSLCCRALLAKRSVEGLVADACSEAIG